MDPVAILDLVSLLASLTALVVVAAGWKCALERDVKFLLAGLLVFNLLYSLFLYVEWSGLTKAFETYEDIIGAILPMWWAFLFYAFLQQYSSMDLLQSEEKYREFIEGTDDFIAQVDGEGRLTFVNDTAAKIFGLDKEECLGLSAFDFIHPDDRERTKAAFEDWIRNRVSSTTFENRQVNQITGKVHHLHWTINFHYGEDKKIAGINSIARDITERKRTEEELNKYGRITSSSSDHLALLDKNYVYQVVNDAYLKAQNKKREDILGHSVPELFGQEFFEKNQKPNIDRCLAGKTVQYQMWINFPSLGQRYMDIIHYPYYEEDGSVSGYVVNARDITDYKRAEEALKKSEKKFRDIFENVSDFLYYHDLEGNFIETNFAFKKEYGINENTLTYPNLKDMIPERYQSQLDDYLNRIKTYGKDEGILIVKTKDGRELSIEYKNSLVYDSQGVPVGVQGSGRDITERIHSKIEKKKMEQQLLHAQKMESIGTLAGGLAHDFNNLLMGIQGRTSMMLNDIHSSSHPHLEHLKSIEDYIKSATDLTKQLLGFARGGKYEVKPTDLNELVNKSSELFGRTKKELIIHRKSQKDIWAVEVDQSQIEQVLLNLFVNAWQSMPSGGELYLQTENVMLDAEYVKPHFIKPGKYVKISVTDTGAGMDKATQERIFDPFFTTREMGRGTGLGLASAYGIVKNHNGIISVYSEEGEGSTFNIYLPASEKEIIMEQELDQDIIKGDKTVLLVDDEKMILDVGQPMLERLGYNVYTAGNGNEAIEIFKNRAKEIDLVILDMIMPDMGGGEIFDQLKTIDNDVKVLLSSGYSINGQASDILKRGCRGFIQKPFSLAEVSKKIHKILG